jgi:hypothetical protein
MIKTIVSTHQTLRHTPGPWKKEMQRLVRQTFASLARYMQLDDQQSQTASRLLLLI